MPKNRGEEKTLYAAAVRHNYLHLTRFRGIETAKSWRVGKKEDLFGFGVYMGTFMPKEKRGHLVTPDLERAIGFLEEQGVVVVQRKAAELKSAQERLEALRKVRRELLDGASSELGDAETGDDPGGAE